MEQPKNTVPDHVVKRIDDLMVAGEKWLGILQPSQKRLSTDCGSLYMLIVSLIGLVVTIGSVFVIFGSISSLREPIWLIVFIPFSFFALFASLFRVIFNDMKAKKYIYAITTQRLIIILPNAAPKSYGKRDITELSLHNLKPNGSGDIMFRQEPLGKGSIYVGFLGVPDVYEVRQLILDTFEFEQTDFWSR